MRLHTIPGKLEVEWDPEIRSIVDTWINYFVTVAQFRAAVLGVGLKHAQRNGGRAWIVDSSRATSVFPREVHACIEEEVFPSFARAGIRYFATIQAAGALTRMTVRNYSAKVGPNGIQLVEAVSLSDAKDWLRAHAA